MIATCLVTHDRLPYTRRCIESWIATARPEDRLVIVDNASTDGTQEYLATLPLPIIHNLTNRFPGPATNQGWDMALGLWEPDFLHRSDNDIEYLEGWPDEAETAFAAHPTLALLGILNLHEDRQTGFPLAEPGAIEPCHRVGGNVVMRPALFAEARWEEGFTEDGPMSEAGHRHGIVAMLVRTVAHNMAFGRYRDFPTYYDETARVRGISDAEHSV
jgi:glycosyltransferase involved in cell wall biosynthesis